MESRSRLNPQNWIGLGLLFAGAAAVSAWLLYKPFLAALAWDIALPLVGHVHLSSVLLFDLGVYMLVVGSTVLVLVALAHHRCARNARPLSKARRRPLKQGSLMELIYAVAIGVLAGSGVWLLLAGFLGSTCFRQVHGRPPSVCRSLAQAGNRDFRLFLVVAGVDGHRPRRRTGVRILSFWLQHLPVLPIVTPLVAGALMLLLADTSRHAGARSPGVHRGPVGRRHRAAAGGAAAGWPGGVGSTWSAIGPRRSASCWWWTGWPPSC